MNTTLYRFTLARAADVSEAESTLLLSVYAVEGLYGRARVRLDANYDVDEEHNAILVDGSNEVGAAIAGVFTSLLLRELGEDAFEVRTVNPQPAARIGDKAA